MKTKAKEQIIEKNCPIHGTLSLRGKEFTGEVKKISGKNTATIELDRLVFIPKYERYEKRKTRIHVHIPTCQKIIVGEFIHVQECRPISKMKNFVMVNKVEK